MAQPSVEVRAPAGQEEGTRSRVLRWLKAIGEPVAEHDPLIELETDKVTVEVAAPGSGVLAEILKDEQEEVSPGDLLGRITPADTLRESAAAAGAATERAAMPAEPAVTAPPAPPARGSKGGAPPDTPDRSASPTHAAATPDGATRLSPAVRRLLAEHRLEAAAVSGTGEGGRITVEDVLRAAAQRKHAAPVPHEAQAASQETSSGGASDAMGAVASHKVPHSAVRKRIAARMVESLLHTAPHVTTVFEIDMGAVLAHRQRHRGEFEQRGVALTLTAYFVRAAVEAIRAVPEANSRWTEESLEIFDSVDFGIGTATPGGLVAPVLRRADTLDLFQTAWGIEDLVRRARAGELTQADVRGGTFTISNHGVSGSLLATPIIIPQPQSAILGVGKLEKRAVVIEDDGEDRIVVRPRCYATLTLDHRVMDGEQANRFMQVLAQRLGNWQD